MAADPNQHHDYDNNNNNDDVDLSDDDSSLSDDSNDGDHNIANERHEPMRQKQTPEDIECPFEPMDIAFHPTHDVLASGLINGEIYLHYYSVPKESAQGSASASASASNSAAATSSEAPSRSFIYKHNVPETSIRCLEFNQDGKSLFAGVSDGALLAIDSSGNVSWKLDKAHKKAAVNAIYPFGEYVLVTGDENGVIKVWDTRAAKSALSFDHHEDAISSFIINEAKHTLIATGLDGTLSAIDLKKGKLIQQSDQLEDELLSSCLLKDGTKVVCGTQQGVLNIYTWGDWGDFSDRFPGHPQSVDAMLKIDEDTIITGSSDGIIRVIQILPNKMLGIVGEHTDLPIERLQYDRTKNLIGSTSHDNFIKFWDVSMFQEGDNDEDSNSGPPARTEGLQKDPVKEFFSDL